MRACLGNGRYWEGEWEGGITTITRKLLRVTDRFITSIGVTVSGDMHIRMPKLTNLHTCNVCTSPYVDNTPRKRFLNYQHDTLGVI